MYTILVCDDERDIVSALEIYLTAEGYRVRTNEMVEFWWWSSYYS